jgi:site-specific recombinase XerD
VRARDYAPEARAANTRRAYRADWRDFTSWCEGHGRPALPAAPETVALYLTDLAGRCKTSTLQRRLSSIAQAHQLAGHAAHDSPTRHATVRAVWAGIRRAKGTAQAGKAPALTADVRAMVATLPDTLLGLRDRALLLLGFAGAFRRSELVGLDVGDLEAGRAGLVVTLRRSKTDQEGEGRKLGVPYGAHPDTCPVRAVQEWLDATGFREGPLFRSVNRHEQVQPGRLSDKAVALVVKRAAAAAGRDPARYAGHSLRAGLATAAAMAGASERSIMAQTGHRSERMVRKYIRDGQLFCDNAAAAVGL